MYDYFEIGKIVNTQGVKGDVRVMPMTDDAARFELLKAVQIKYKNEIKHLTIERVWYHKQFVILKFSEISDRTAADGLRDGIIIVPPEQALPLDENEFYIKHLYGMAVETTDGETLGEIADVIFTGANDVYSVKNKQTNEEILIPAIKQCIVKVDTAGKKMVVKLLEGLRGL